MTADIFKPKLSKRKTNAIAQIARLTIPRIPLICFSLSSESSDFLKYVLSPWLIAEIIVLTISIVIRIIAAILNPFLKSGERMRV